MVNSVTNFFKETGINRELYNLLGQNTPPVPVRHQQKFKDRLNSLAKPSPWTWTHFKNGARRDSLELHHWVKGSKEAVEAAEVPYKFEKYNTSLNIPTFTEEDYHSFIKEEPVEENPEIEMEVDDKSSSVKETADESQDSKEKSQEENPIEMQIPWDYEETRYLFDLSVAFDLKWVVIHDRYDFKDRLRSMEDLQERFYFVCQRILIHENDKEEDAQNSNLISNLNFNKKKEVERKIYLNRLLERSPAEIAEEESLLIEARKFEVAAKKTITERASLLQLLDSPQATGSIGQYLSSQGLTQLYNNLMTEKRKRRVDSPAPENPLTALNEKIKQQHIQRQKQLQQEKLEQQKKRKENPISTLLSKNLTPREEEEFGLRIHTEKISPGVALRSTKVSSYKPGVQAKITAILNEMGLGKKPVLATAKVVAKQEELYKTINTLLDLKRQVDKIEAESKFIK